MLWSREARPLPFTVAEVLSARNQVRILILFAELGTLEISLHCLGKVSLELFSKGLLWDLVRM